MDEHTERLALECLKLAQSSPAEEHSKTDQVIGRARAYFNFITDPNPKQKEEPNEEKSEDFDPIR